MVTGSNHCRRRRRRHPRRNISEEQLDHSQHAANKNQYRPQLCCDNSFACRRLVYGWPQFAVNHYQGGAICPSLEPLDAISKARRTVQRRCVARWEIAWGRSASVSEVCSLIARQCYWHLDPGCNSPPSKRFRRLGPIGQGLGVARLLGSP